MFFVGCVGVYVGGIEGPPDNPIPRLGLVGVFIGGGAFVIGIALLIFVIARLLFTPVAKTDE